MVVTGLPPLEPESSATIKEECELSGWLACDLGGSRSAEGAAVRTGNQSLTSSVGRKPLNRKVAFVNVKTIYVGHFLCLNLARLGDGLVSVR